MDSLFISHANKAVPCGETIYISLPCPSQTIGQTPGGLCSGDNPIGMSYMVGYGARYVPSKDSSSGQLITIGGGPPGPNRVQGGVTAHAIT
ncbi:hypothetical protein CCACVL1_22759 [Corchorus capsularis]|uniref:Uncharacterized protein n=1 Tax=Corchorus capsularis TaxID=210143 RepID=A0A1R3GWZ3_COCAP|nr:hypothetical protein CCACVL1_22759 [Corchorus capsularis]